MAMKEKAYLTDWMSHMSEENPLNSIYWLIGGAIHNESMVERHILKLHQDVRRAFPDLHQRLYTNCHNVEGWQESYIMETRKYGLPDSHAFQTSVSVVTTMYQEEGLPADVYVCNDISASFAVYGHGLSMWNKPHPPVVTVFSKVPEGTYSSYLLDENAARLFYYAGRDETHWVAIADNANEEKQMRKLLSMAGVSNFSRVRRYSTYEFDRKAWVEADEKEDIVVWSGRPNSMKNPTLGAQVCALVPPEVRKRAFYPRPPGKDPFVNVAGAETVAGQPPDVYRAMTRNAKVLVISSVSEAFPIGYLELMAQGVVPVVWDKPWAKDLMPEGWELFYKTPGEGAEMVLEVLEHYEEYAKIVKEWMPKRFGKTYDFADTIKEVWDDYTVKLGDRVRLVLHRGERKSL